MMEIFEFIHLIEISGLVEISDVQKFSGLWKPMYEPFTFHLSFDCSMLRKKTLQFLLRPMENVYLIRSLTCASLDMKLIFYSGKIWDSQFSFPKFHSEHEYSESPSKLHHLKRRGRCHVNLVSLSSFFKFDIRNSLPFWTLLLFRFHFLISPRWAYLRIHNGNVCKERGKWK